MAWLGLTSRHTCLSHDVIGVPRGDMTTLGWKWSSMSRRTEQLDMSWHSMWSRVTDRTHDYPLDLDQTVNFEFEKKWCGDRMVLALFVLCTDPHAVTVSMQCVHRHMVTADYTRLHVTCGSSLVMACVLTAWYMMWLLSKVTSYHITRL